MENLVTAVENEVKAVETKVETVAEAVKAEVVKVASEVKAEIAKVEPEVKKALVEISTEEKLMLRETELSYLKLQVQIKELSAQTEALSKKYMDNVEKLFSKYLLTKAEYVFDGAVNSFKKL
jgi:hypothetical protein